MRVECGLDATFAYGCGNGLRLCGADPSWGPQQGAGDGGPAVLLTTYWLLWLLWVGTGLRFLCSCTGAATAFGSAEPTLGWGPRKGQVTAALTRGGTFPSCGRERAPGRLAAYAVTMLPMLRGLPLGASNFSAAHADYRAASTNVVPAGNAGTPTVTRVLPTAIAADSRLGLFFGLVGCCMDPGLFGQERISGGPSA